MVQKLLVYMIPVVQKTGNEKQKKPSGCDWSQKWKIISILSTMYSLWEMWWVNSRCKMFFITKIISFSQHCLNKKLIFFLKEY